VNTKTKRVAGVDLSPRCFAYVGDPDDTSTWKLPLHVLGDATKTVNAIKDSLGRFQQTQGIPEHLRESVRLLCIGAAIAHHVPVDRSVLTKTVVTPAQGAELTTQQLKELEAIADARADELLAALGLD